MSRRRVVITGLGTVNPLANDVGGFWKALLAGKSGIAPITQFDTSAFKVHFGGEVKDFQPETHLDAKTVRRQDRFSQFAMLASIEAMRDSGLTDTNWEDPFRCGVILGSGIGGLNEYEDQHTIYRERGPNKISPFVIPKMIANAAAGNVSIHFGMAGPNTAVSTACASASNAIADACRAIQHDYADVMLCGGAEAAITPMGLGGFCAARALSQRNDDPTGASRPFDRERDGFVLSEGAGMVVLEEFEHAKKRGAPVYAELLGVGCTADAYHVTAPHPEGAGARKAMELALRDARLNPSDVQYVNAHGTSTELGDVGETKAIKQAFGEHARKLAVSSTKSMIGHLLGASGGVALVACVLSLRHRVLHPTINLRHPDPLCDLDYVPNQARETRVVNVLANSFGFGGHNCTLAVGTLR
jgi:3-oxoacyl-[acyl-carrier-protein] synthase II